jgi:hypothetical protein
MIIREGEQLAEMFGGGACFHCREPVSTPFIHWNAGHEDRGGLVILAFHPRCALHFGLRLMRDVHELDADESLSFGAAPDIRPGGYGA